MSSVTILCEGPKCNDGQSAAQRQHSLVRALATPTLEAQAEAERHARSEVSKTLALRPHTLTGLGRGGNAALRLRRMRARARLRHVDVGAQLLGVRRDRATISPVYKLVCAGVN